jgi:hypothetical protein
MVAAREPTRTSLREPHSPLSTAEDVWLPEGDDVVEERETEDALRDS